MMYLAYGAVLAIILAMDALWLGLIAKDFFVSRIGHLFAESPNWWSAGVFYLAFAAALMYFVVLPSYNESSVWMAIVRGAFFGAIAYATYDLTNMTLMKDWPLSVTLVDISWGALVAAAGAIAGFLVLSSISN